jgi:hypothetical protein
MKSYYMPVQELIGIVLFDDHSALGIGLVLRT